MDGIHIVAFAEEADPGKAGIPAQPEGRQGGLFVETQASCGRHFWKFTSNLGLHMWRYGRQGKRLLFLVSLHSLLSSHHNYVPSKMATSS